MPAALLVRLLVWSWFGLALAAGYFGWLRRLPPFGVQAMILGLTGLVLLLYFQTRPLRHWIDALDLRALVLFHVTRFIGIYFLVLYQRGELPRAFALPAGFGDIIVATMALPVALAPLEAGARLRAVRIWNVVGLIDILLVIASATRINLTHPEQLRPLLHLPLSLLPTLLVPLIVATHVIIFARLARTERAA